MKLITLCGDSLERVREFPEEARRKADRQHGRPGVAPSRRRRAPSALRGEVFRGGLRAACDLGFPEAEARNLALRSQLAICIDQFVESSGLTQARAAARLGLTQPRLNAVLKGKLEQFSLDALVNTATRAGLHVELRVTSPRRGNERAAATA